MSLERLRVLAAGARRRPGAAAVLGTALLAAGLGLGWLVQRGLAPSSETAPQARSAGSKVTAAPDFVMPPAETFAAVLERPLFSPSRRMPDETAPVLHREAAPIDLDLIGVITTQGRRVAILRPDAAATETEGSGSARSRRDAPPAAIKLSEGDPYRDWVLERIEPDAALFVRGEEEAWLELMFQAAAPAQPRRAETTGAGARQTANQRRQAQDDPPDDLDGDGYGQGNREATSEERVRIVKTLKMNGCSEAQDLLMILDDGFFEIEDVACDDGYSYTITLDDKYQVVDRRVYQ